MNRGVLAFGLGCVLRRRNVYRKRILEVGSRNVNGSLRPFVRAFLPREYIGVDIVPGRGVDEICDVYELRHRFDVYSFDGVICTEMIEHVEDYSTAVIIMRSMVAPGGWMFLSAPGPGFPPHDYPHDYHRFTPQDLIGLLDGWDVEAYGRTVENESCAFGRRPRG